MKTVIYYYTMTGQCEHLATKIASRLDCDVERIVESRKRLSKGFLRFLNGASAMRKKPAEIKPLGKDPSEYERVILVTPFWAGNPTPGARGFLTEYAESLKGKRLGLAMTNFGSDPEEVLPLYRELFPEPVVTATFTRADGGWEDPKETELIEQFVTELGGSA